MIIFPAIDLYEGQAVRLFKGDYNQMTVYDKAPVNTLQKFAAAGATHVHLVDLEGAKGGETTNLAVIQELAQNTHMFLQVGGGIRNMDTVRAYLSAGVNRVILGTAAVKNPDFVAEAVKAYGKKIAVGVDLKDGYVAVSGWTETSQHTCFSFCRQMQDLGVQTIICTDISKDGAMEGTNLDLYRNLQSQFSMEIIASGGVSSLDDVKALRDSGIYGAIIGKAYYTGAIDLEEAIALGGEAL